MFLFSDGLSVIVRRFSLISNKIFLFQHDLTPWIYALHKITIALKFISCINQKLQPSYQTVLNLCLTCIRGHKGQNFTGMSWLFGLRIRMLWFFSFGILMSWLFVIWKNALKSRCHGLFVSISRCRGVLVPESRCRVFLVLESWCRGICASMASFSLSSWKQKNHA